MGALSAALLAACSCGAAHEIDGGGTLPDGAPSSPFPSCGNPRPPIIEATSCSAEAEIVCRQWALSFGVPSGLVDGHCEQVGPSGGPVLPTHKCFTGTVCDRAGGGVTFCSCSATEHCTETQICAQDSPGDAPHCVSSCADPSRCIPLAHGSTSTGLPLWVQGTWCPADAGVDGG